MGGVRGHLLQLLVVSGRWVTAVCRVLRGLRAARKHRKLTVLHVLLQLIWMWPFYLLSFFVSISLNQEVAMAGEPCYDSSPQSRALSDD